MAVDAKLIVAASEQDSDIYYASHFWAPDAFIYAEIAGKKLLVMNDLEVDRARSEAKVDEVLSYSDLAKQTQVEGMPPGMISVLELLFREREVDQVVVPNTFPLGIADQLRERGVLLETGGDPFYPERTVKTAEEVAAIRETIAQTQDALAAAIDLVRNSEIKEDELWLNGKPLTSEMLRKTMHMHLLGLDCLGQETIIAGGVQACDPHCIGYGPLKAHWPIIFDVFPVSLKTRYYADISRTVIKGTPSDKAQRMYDAVLEGQELGISMIKAGADGKAIHEAIQQRFESQGFMTGVVEGRMQGFFHGTGHGLGLDIHEAPRIGGVKDILKAGQVVTCEPGLYYPDAGGVRIEDDILVTEDGCESLSTFEKVFRLD